MNDMESMDSEPTSAFSPADPSIDSLFFSKHNLSVETYQIFKNDVDVLLSGKTSISDQPLLIQKIIRTCHEMLATYEDEKAYLMGDVLCTWAIRQQKISIGTLWTQQLHYNQLDTIHQEFEYFGEVLQHTISGLEYLIQYFPSQGFEDMHSKFRQMAHYFLYYSIIVSRQPPSVIVKCGEAENHRRSRFWFNTEIRILGGRAFGLETAGSGVEVQCYLITDETARQLLSNAYFEIFESEEFSIEPPNATFHVKEHRGLKAKFDDMRIAKKVQLRRESVATKRYCLCYNIRLKTSCGIDLVGKKVSLPFAVLVGPKTDVEAKLFLERSFADLVRQPLSEVPPHVSAVEMADQLEMKFQAIVETPQKSTDGPAIIQPRSFTPQAKEHIIKRLKPTPHGYIVIDNFMKLPVAEEFQQKKTSGTEGDWKLVPFFDWFFKLAEIVNKYLYSMWFDGLIYGFCGKEEAEQLLRSVPRSVLLIRFSDIEQGKVKISVKNSLGEMRHHWYEHSDLNARPLAKELLTNPKFSDIELIFPDIDLEVALGGRQKPRRNLPKHLQPNDIYFDNQGAATSAF
ncbi:unnamed protein product, partial [Mesorhabditis spiculigera]